MREVSLSQALESMAQFRDDGLVYPPDHRHKWTQWQLDFLIHNYTKLTNVRLAERLGCTTHAIQNRVRVLKLGRKPLLKHRLRKKARFKPFPSRDFAYVLGAILGDGHIDREDTVVLVVKDRDFAEAFSGCLGRLLNTQCNVSSSVNGFGVRRVVVSMRRWLRGQTMASILRILQGFEADFIAGFFDAEGSVSWNTQQGVHVLSLRYCELCLSNSNPVLILLARRLLLDLGIEHKLAQRGWCVREWGTQYVSICKPSYQIRITKQSSIRVFQSRIRLQIVRKRESLERLIRFLELSHEDRRLCDRGSMTVAPIL